jgi:hypothetical protein
VENEDALINRYALIIRSFAPVPVYALAVDAFITRPSFARPWQTAPADTFIGEETHSTVIAATATGVYLPCATATCSWPLAARPIGASASRAIEAWKRRTRLRVESEGADKQIHDAPYGHHEEKAGDAVNDEGAAFLALLFISAMNEKILQYAPYEEEERDSEDEGDNRAIDYLYEIAYEADDLHR